MIICIILGVFIYALFKYNKHSNQEITNFLLNRSASRGGGAAPVGKPSGGAPKSQGPK